MRNCLQTSGNPESKYFGEQNVFYWSKKYSKLVILDPRVSDGRENTRFSNIYKGIPFINEPNTHFLVRSHFFYHEIYEKSTFFPDPIGPQITSFEYFLDL